MMMMIMVILMSNEPQTSQSQDLQEEAVQVCLNFVVI